MELLLTVEQAAQRLQLAPFTVREQLKRGQLRGLKRGRVWRIPESALTESSPTEQAPVNEQAPANEQVEVERLWNLLADKAMHNAAIIAIARAPRGVRDAISERSAEAARAYYTTPTGQSELADWRALDGKPFELGAND